MQKFQPLSSCVYAWMKCVLLHVSAARDINRDFFLLVVMVCASNGYPKLFLLQVWCQGNTFKWCLVLQLWIIESIWSNFRVAAIYTLCLVGQGTSGLMNGSSCCCPGNGNLAAEVAFFFFPSLSSEEIYWNSWKKNPLIWNCQVAQSEDDFWLCTPLLTHSGLMLCSEEMPNHAPKLSHCPTV